jgi:hypothetical protein
MGCAEAGSKDSSLSASKQNALDTIEGRTEL